MQHIHKIEKPLVCLEDVRERLGITQDDDVTRDAVHEARIMAAQHLLELECGTVFTERTVTTYAQSGDEKILLLRPYLSDLVVEYKDALDVWQPYAQAGAEFDDIAGVYYFDKLQPETISTKRNAYRLTYKAGYATGDYTAPLIEAMHITLMMWERQQALVASGARPMTLPYAALQLCSGFRDFRKLT